MATMSNALWLMMIGMITLFIFFCFLYALLRFSTWLYQQIIPMADTAGSTGTAKPAVPNAAGSLPAVLAAAIHRFRSRR